MPILRVFMLPVMLWKKADLAKEKSSFGGGFF
jgi:hypothetical protein